MTSSITTSSFGDTVSHDAGRVHCGPVPFSEREHCNSNAVHLTVLTQYYPPEIGAPQVRLSELAAHFVQRGHSVTVLTAMPNYPTGKIYPGYSGLLRREHRDGVSMIRTFIYPTQKTDFMPRLMNYFSFVLSSATLGSALLGRADYLLVESPPLFLGLSGFWLSRLKHARLIFNVSDLWPETAVRLGILQPGSLACRSERSGRGILLPAGVAGHRTIEKYFGEHLPTLSRASRPSIFRTAWIHSSSDPTDKAIKHG